MSLKWYNEKDYKRKWRNNSTILIKIVNATPVLKRHDQIHKENYHLLSILSKIYERCMHNKMCKDFDEVPPKSKYDFCKGFPLVMVEKYRRVLDIGRISGVS